MNASQVDTNGKSLYISSNEKPYQIQIKIIDSRYYSYASFDRESKKKGKEKEEKEVKYSGQSGSQKFLTRYIQFASL
jgi:hypothetical protein